MIRYIAYRMMDKLLTPEEVAERFAVSPKTLRDWLRTGKMKGIKVGGKLWRVSESDLDQFIESSKIQVDKRSKKKTKRK